ncbi:MAG: MFS transporter, partial [Deltaproteobacteria bacterium]|nr:MFS transporter [Deltaproteobacteria bacterium]
LTGFLIESFNWRIAYWGLAALALGGMLPLVWFFLTDRPEERGLTPLGQGSLATSVPSVTGERDAEPEGWTLKEALYTPTFWLLGAAFCLGLMAALATAAHQVAFLQDTGLTLESASTVAGVTLGISMGGRFMVGWASEHTRHLHSVLSYCLVMQAVGIGALSCLSFLGFWAVVIFVAFFGLGYGGLVVLWPLIIGHDFGLRAFGAIAGALGTVSASLGGAVGPVMVGAIYDHTGSYFWAFVACTIVLLLGAGAALMAPELSSASPELTPGRAVDHKGETVRGRGVDTAS